MGVPLHYKLWGKESNVEGLGDHLYMKPWVVDVCQCCVRVCVCVCMCTCVHAGLIRTILHSMHSATVKHA